MTPLQIAELRCADLELVDQQLFLVMFERGRASTAGADTQREVWRLRTADDYPVLLAGYIEGLASTRVHSPLFHLVPDRQLTCGRDSYAGYEAHRRAGEPACQGCLADAARRTAEVKQRRVTAS